MGDCQASRSLEAMFIGIKFPFDKPSPEVRHLRRMLLSGISVAVTPTDIPDGYGGKSRPEVVAAFFVVDGEEYRSQMRLRHGEHMTETTGESVFQLGVASAAAKRVLDAIATDCSAYLIPEEGEGVFGRYTLCVIDSPPAK